MEIDGVEVEVAAEIYCDRSGDHRELVDRARADRRKHGHNVDDSAVLCMRWVKVIPLRV